MTELVTITGLRELREALLRKVPDHMQGKVLQKALAAGAKPIVEAAKALAPVKTGTLRKAIYSFRDKESRPGYEIRNIRPRQGKRFAKKGEDAYYWKFVEFGHRVGKRGGGKLKKIGKGANAIAVVPPKPFMRPAFESQKGAALVAITEALKVEIDIAAQKASWGGSFSAGAQSARSAIGEISDLLEPLSE